MKNVQVEIDEVECRVEDVKHLIDFFQRELDVIPEDERYKRDQIISRLYPLVNAYAEALSSGEAEGVALVQLQSVEVKSKADLERVALEKFKVRSFHWTIRAAVAALIGTAWLVFA